MLVLLFWPDYICRELTDVELKEAYNSDEQCEQESHDHLKLVKNDTVVEMLQRSDNSADNISWLNIRTSINSNCWGYRKRIFLWAHIFELITDKKVQVVVKFDKPLTLTVVGFPTDYTFVDENMSPYPIE
uniref:DUF4283 domain-containing protein n=1 Tax=Setaria digitata TaxID=48799 RepID=A0A915PI08_9BILA